MAPDGTPFHALGVYRTTWIVPVERERRGEACAVDVERARTARGTAARFTLGLGWDDPAYNASLASSASPWSRRPSQGFRLATYPNGDPDPSLSASVDVSFPDYESMKPLSDDALELLDQMSRYAKGAVVAEESPIELADEIRGVRAEVDASYSEEDLPVLVFPPDGVAPPYPGGRLVRRAERDPCSRQHDPDWLRPEGGRVPPPERPSKYDGSRFTPHAITGRPGIAGG